MVSELHRMLRMVGSRMRKLRSRWSLAACWFAWAAIAAALWRNAERLQFSGTQLGLAIAAGAALTAIVCHLLAARRTYDPDWVARRIESRHPDLGAALLAALQQAPAPGAQRLGYLQSAVVREAVRHGHKHRWERDVSTPWLSLAQLAQLSALALLVAACTLLVQRGNALARSAGSAAEDKQSVRPVDPTVQVEPGDTEIERGTTLLVTAEFGRALPIEATLVVEPARESTDKVQEQRVSNLPMMQSFDDPKFVGRLASVSEDLLYAVEFDGRRTRQYRIVVFDYPALERADAELVFPDYTSLPPKQIEDVRHVTAVEGTELVFRCRLNKDVSEAVFVDREDRRTPLVRADDAAPVYTVALTLKESQRFTLHLTDDQGRGNKTPPEFVVNVVPNRPPKITLARPARDVRVSPIEELDVAGEVSDDFGLLRYGINYTTPGGATHDVVLGDPSDDDNLEHSVRKRAELSHLVDLEALDAKPDQLLAYYLWAEDVGPDGQTRQTMSDMYFAEVRHFEEIFRQGEQPTQQQMQEAQQQQQQGHGAAQQAAELAELQKQIINATWALVRRERDGSPSPRFADDAGVLVESQQQALTQLDEVAGETTDEESLAYVAEVRESMETAAQRLDESSEAAGVAGLRPAMAAEQAAYQALLKLRAREFSVIQGNPQQQGAQSGSASGASSRSQQQLNQLELSSEENRYETQSRAQDQRLQAQGGTEEARQVLDRLRELARRQQDLNERLRQLQSELQAADTERQRQQLERELKRLREQQQEILRDADQLQNEMASSANAQDTADAQQQLAETRDRVQQAAEALERGQLSEAVSEGTRAERELNELSDEFRRRTADRFSEELRELRSSARQLDERQQQLAETLAEQREQRSRSLRDDSTREELLQGLAEQQRAFEDLIERLQETVQEAEEPEPLLARQLYDTVRKATNDRVADALDVSEQMLEVGMEDGATEMMRAANRGIRSLREGVDGAAQSVLGDETEALRRAEQELQQLQEQLDREIEQALGENAAEQQSGRPAANDGREPRQSNASQEATSRDAGQRQREGTQPGGAGNSPPREQQPQGGAGDEQARQNQPPSGSRNSNGQAGEQQTADQPQGGEVSAAADGQPPPRASGAQQPGGRPPGSGDPAGDRGGAGPDMGAWFDQWREGPAAPAGPITGDDFREWDDRLRNVEDLLEDPELRADVARIRDRAEAARADYKRRSQDPDWERLIDSVAEPLAEVRTRIRDEIRRHESPDALVPIDRDPIPADYIDRVREYYERLGSGK
ncbi:MAG: hypothetical protein CMJ58_02195 [Planctomycetaceae bacterium]|nr:hypothetical protein [Planctomycetaceae bacterium]